MASISLSVGGPSFTISPVVCAVSSEKAAEKAGRARPCRGNKGGLTPKYKRGRPRGGVVSIEQRVHTAWQWGYRVLGANDLSGTLLPVGYSHAERRVRKRGVVTGKQSGSFAGSMRQGHKTELISHDFTCRI